MASRKEIIEAMDRGIADHLADTVTYRDPETGEINSERFVPICDFCLTREEPIPWSYPCGFVEIGVNPLMNVSDTPWAACQVCHDFIEADDYAALMERSFHAQMEAVGLKVEDLPESVVGTVRAHQREHFERFKAARTGPPLAEGQFDPKTGRPNDPEDA